jgi:hypothetical protein
MMWGAGWDGWMGWMASALILAILWASLVALSIFAVRALWDRFFAQGDHRGAPAVGTS